MKVGLFGGFGQVLRPGCHLLPDPYLLSDRAVLHGVTFCLLGDNGCVRSSFPSGSMKVKVGVGVLGREASAGHFPSHPTKESQWFWLCNFEIPRMSHQTLTFHHEPRCWAFIGHA